MSRPSYLDATQEAGKQFFLSHPEGPVVMLNLLRFREVADYTDVIELKPLRDISGREAYSLYMEATLPYLAEAGSEVLFYGKSSHFLIGPTDEQWDAALLVKHLSAEQFISFAQNEGYLATLGHRTAALADSRLLPIVEGDFIHD